jgi:hypothetical protein
MCKNSNLSNLTSKVMEKDGEFSVGWYLTSHVFFLYCQHIMYDVNTNWILTNSKYTFKFSVPSSNNSMGQSLRRTTQP